MSHNEGNSAAESRASTSGRKKKVRGGHRAHTTKILVEVDTLLEHYSAKDETQLIAFKSRLQRKVDVVSKLDEDILNDVETESEITDEIEDAEAWHSRVCQKVFEIDEVIRKSLKGKVDEGETSRPSGTSRAQVHVKLPKYEIEKFNGDPKKYLEFKDAFNVSIANNNNLQKAEKFTYLRSFLSGEALRLIAGLA